MTTYHETEVLTPRGNPAVVLSRDGTSDLSLAGSMFRLWDKLDDEYRLADLFVDGVFIDVGAHAGYVTLAVLLDNPNATAICLEPLPENLDLLAANMDRNGVASRVTMLQGVLGKGKTATVAYDYDGDEYARTNRFIGALESASSTHQSQVTVPAYTFRSLVGAGADAAKFDCEGCEWTGLREKAVAKVRVIFGEWHGHSLDKVTDGTITLRKHLEPTHDFEVLDDLVGTGVFRAVRR